MASLQAMCETLGDELRPITRTPLPTDSLTGVHVSELADPTTFLDGGELLLTTGVPLVDMAEADVVAYVSRLVARHIAALGFGLGAGYEEPDRRLVTACEQQGLPLLEVPGPTPFQLISRTYWALVGKEETRELTSTLAAHLSLASAMTTKAPRQAVVKALATAVEGWAAHMTASGELVCVWPHDRLDVAVSAAPHVMRVGDSGPASTSTFPLGPDVVHMHTLSSEDRISGFLLCGRPKSFGPAQRHLIASAAMLLSVHGNVRRRQTEHLRATRSDFLKLSMGGFDQAARFLRDPHCPGAAGVRVLAISELAPHERLELVDSIEAAVPAAHAPVPMVRDTEGSFLLFDAPDTRAPVRATESFLTRIAPHARAVISAETTLEHLPRLTPRIRRALRTAPPGTVADLGCGDDLAANVEEALRLLKEYERADLVSAVVAYLATRGNWERSAGQLGIHRNSMRNRMATALEVSGLDLDDPDIASALWLRLRAEGMA